MTSMKALDIQQTFTALTAINVGLKMEHDKYLDAKIINLEEFVRRLMQIIANYSGPMESQHLKDLWNNYNDICIDIEKEYNT